MFQICPKCAYVRKLDDTMSSDVCPGCGLIYSNFLKTSGKKEKALLHAKRSSNPDGKSGSFFLKLMLFALLVAAASYLYKIKHQPPAKPLHSTSPPIVANAQGIEQQREFADLFSNDISLASLARQGQYTVVEVYLDQCAYCRELEAALKPFQEQRADVSVIRVHHPGAMNSSVQGNSREELEAKLSQMKSRMASYQLCGSPHVEVFGPDGAPIAVDTCNDHAGTAFLWDWIATETGVTRRTKAGMFTRM